MKKLVLASAISALAAGGAFAEDINIGVILGFTGPLESITPGMAAGAEMAMSEVNAGGGILSGSMINSVRADSTCIDSAAAQAGAERLITSDNVVAIMGADCSGVTRAILENVAMANGIPMISPSATSPGFTEFDSGGLFFRTSPSDARQGQVLADILVRRGITSVATTHTNNDYGLGLATAFNEAFEAAGGTVTATVPHEEAKGDYSAEVGALASAGGEALMVLGYVDGGGSMISTAWDLGAFDHFFVGDGVYGDDLLPRIGEAASGLVGTVPWAVGAAADRFVEVYTEAGVDGASSYVAESYDAAALLMLAAQAAGEATPAGIAANVLNVANAPGEEIFAGDLARAVQILAEGGEVNYQGATNVELIGFGEASGSYREFNVVDGDFATVQYH
ncbi:ABC transporter substrate-binding protein [Pararhodobacter oceanensis]|uniref:Branched-chain amino acid ABC transporter substrate-binding protein n=1 Tax=Pararhodobacter oceanensis TaxID=2172121 RepID=A0A2T8HTF4_9RHOB|nr:ABC transporter substrate-binding protein [Pararhodobacter oceanensis]PVH28734.1 branched-chain amino acid ABC transporter substrate-binding protein [Pararhodobacter oceanensis]